MSTSNWTQERFKEDLFTYANYESLIKKGEEEGFAIKECKEYYAQRVLGYLKNIAKDTNSVEEMYEKLVQRG